MNRTAAPLPNTDNTSGNDPRNRVNSRQSSTELDRIAANIADARRRALAAQDAADRAKANYGDQLDHARETLTDDELRALTVRLLDLRPDSTDLLDRPSIRFEEAPF